MEDLLTLVGMLLTVGLVLALAFLFTRYFAGRAPGLSSLGRARGGLVLLDQMPLGREHRLVLVRVGERHLLLGVSPGGVSLLCSLTQEEAQRWREEAPQPRSPGEAPGFGEALRDALSRKKR